MLAAFETDAEAKLVRDLREQGDAPIELVAEARGRVIGSIVFGPITIEGGDGRLRAMGLAPLAVDPAWQGRGVGGALVRQGLRACEDARAGAVFVLGEPGYYARFGFETASKHGFGNRTALMAVHGPAAEEPARTAGQPRMPRHFRGCRARLISVHYSARPRRGLTETNPKKHRSHEATAMSQDIIAGVQKSQLKTDLPEITIGANVDVHVRIIEGAKERIQVFSGVVIKMQNGGLDQTMTVRRIVANEGVERTVPLHSPRIAKIEVVRRGDTRRAKLYYLRDRVGKKRRLRDQRRGLEALAMRETARQESTKRPRPRLPLKPNKDRRKRVWFTRRATMIHQAPPMCGVFV